MAVLITGGSGMVGHAFKSVLPDAAYVSSEQYDLRSLKETQDMFSAFKPECVIHLAAKVGGVMANSEMVADFYTENTQINTNVLYCAHKHNTKKVVSFLSTCVYPDDVSYPLTEDQLHLGAPHPSNFGYAYAKRMVDTMSRAYRQQYGRNFITAIPNNLYGENDNYHLQDGHVIPALMNRIWYAKINNLPEVECWGDGLPRREFTYSGDAAEILVFLLENYNGESPVNIGNTEEYSIKEVVGLLCEYLEYDGEIKWNTDKPSGQFRKPSSNEKLIDMGWKREWYTPVREGLKKSCEWFIMNYPNVRGVE